ncbi:hypothetical protein HDE68_003347 [Pedobacter cryoconitis]|uniref:Uncharacterized protein n=1 Tax=Pedobacter cryoconitis TaxID=188932 RepID=A0A7W9DZK3_9SPHI|nr:hypothetical protein [Pedobacter cryoconitis]MBB5637432.1 hypothetical protein [Pedobacter cryoconitis]
MIRTITKTITKKLLLLAVISLSSSCAKEIIQPKEEIVQKPKMEELTGYYSKLVRVKPSDMIYNEKTEQFSIFGTDQISLSDLTEIYKINNPQN